MNVKKLLNTTSLVLLVLLVQKSFAADYYPNGMEILKTLPPGLVEPLFQEFQIILLLPGRPFLSHQILLH